MNTSDLIQVRHLERRAVIYVRQSSPNQVLNNQESQRLQYALRERAIQLGWHEQDVEIIDLDLGQTAATTEGRAGFQELVAQVALGEVGILIAYDATRLARNCSHWYQLLDLCGRTDCLIADRDGVYDPTSINGRLLLGLKGQISELELHTIRARLTAGHPQQSRTRRVGTHVADRSDPARIGAGRETSRPRSPAAHRAGLRHAAGEEVARADGAVAHRERLEDPATRWTRRYSVEASDGSEHRFDGEESGLCRRVRVRPHTLEKARKTRGKSKQTHLPIDQWRFLRARQVPGLHFLGNV